MLNHSKYNMEITNQKVEKYRNTKVGPSRGCIQMIITVCSRAGGFYCKMQDDIPVYPESRASQAARHKTT